MQEIPEWNATLEEKCRFTFNMYFALLSDILLAAARDLGQSEFTEMTYRMNLRHHYNFFLTGLKKLGIENEAADAIKCGKYHYLSNALGGIDMEYVEETPEKVWIRYLTYLSHGLSAMPAKSCGEAVFASWHARNGAALGNPRLGFVVTAQAANGDPYYEGYFKIYDHDLRPDETLKYSPGEAGPPFDPAKAPKLDPKEWPAERKAKALRNYSVDYVNDTISSLLETYGPIGARPIIERGYRIYMASRYKEICKGLKITFREVSGLETTGTPTSAKGVATLFQRMASLLDEEIAIKEVSYDEYILRQSARNPRLFPVLFPVEIDEAIIGGWKVLVRLLNYDLTIDMTKALSAGDPYYERVVKRRWLPSRTEGRGSGTTKA